jgi:hypothetical protein
VPYSVNFFTGPCAADSITWYTVPANYVAVIREIDYYNASAGTINNIHNVVTNPGPTAAIFGWVASMLTLTGYQWRGRVVVPAGGILQLSGTDPSFYMTASGYLLSAP